MQTVHDLSGTPLRISIPLYPQTPCKRCGFKGHFTVVCKAKVDTKGKELESDDEYRSE